MGSDAETIARGLSPAQKRALLWLPDDGSWRLRSGADAPPPNKFNILKGHGLADGQPIRQGQWNWRLTPLGLLVRASLSQAGAREVGDA